MRHSRSLPRWTFGTLVLSLLGAVLLWELWPAEGQADPVVQLFKAPELEGGVDWINTAGPVHLSDLRGKIVVLDFWTYCCINCHHVLPDLAKLEAKYKNALVVIGVHTAKFPAERETDNIRKKVREYGIKHPVVNDANQVIWNKYEVQGWPSLVVIDANGNQSERPVSGEGHGQALDLLIGRLVRQHKSKGELDESPVHFRLESEKSPHTSPLNYPGKVLADGAGKRLFISDTVNNRIVVTDLDGKLIQVYGNGGVGMADGGPEEATFHRPQGMCLVDETLYVCDTENHAIRAIDLKDETVSRVAGNGRQLQRPRQSSASADESLNSPWDILPAPGSKTSLYIAMAGPHQIWRLDLAKKTAGPWAGSGREDIRDGDLDSAQFAQPSGLATDGKHLFVADSEVSGVRSVTFQAGTAQRVKTIVGVGLFGFGDEDGEANAVRLQHCLGLAYGDGKLYIADTYNNRIKVCDPKTRAVTSFVGDHQPGETDTPPRFDEPGGLSLLGQQLYVADTNNHRIRVVNLKTKKVRTLALEGVKDPQAPGAPPSFPRAAVFDAPETRVAPGEKIELQVTLDLARGFKINPETPMPYLLETPKETGILSPDVSPVGANVDPPSATFTVTVPLAAPAADGQKIPLRLSVSAMTCREGSEGICVPKNYVWNIPVAIAEGGVTRVRLTNKETKKPKAE